MRRVVILGSTGSIGVQALDVLRATDGLEVVALSAGRRWEELIAQATSHGVRRVAIADPESAEAARAAWDGEVLSTIERLTLTASGGPFRGRSREELDDVTVEQALNHPTWQMGGKISIDSATLMNKGLEVIEAHQLFGTPYDKIDVVVHPQSIVHAMISLADGSSLAHLGYPDMRVPIAFALQWPNRQVLDIPGLDLEKLAVLSFEAVDHEAFPCLGLALSAGKEGGTAPCVLNAANEIAVAGFLARRCSFLEIASVIAATLDAADFEQSYSFETLIETDRRSREFASDYLSALG